MNAHYNIAIVYYMASLLFDNQRKSFNFCLVMWSLSIRGTLRYWPIEDEYKNNTTSFDRDKPDSVAIQTIVLDIPDPVHACMSPNNQTLIIASSNEWRV